MSTGRSILFLAEEKTPMVKLIQNSIREIHSNWYPTWKPMIIKKDEFEGEKPMEAYSSMWVFPEGEDMSYFGGEDVFENRFDFYNKKYKLWADMGGSNTTFKDPATGRKSLYPIRHFKALMDKIQASDMKNDVLLLCTTTSGGGHRSQVIS